jgi:hypothetical protein
MHVLQVAERNFRVVPPVPFRLHADERLVLNQHDASRFQQRRGAPAVLIQ